MRLKLTPEQAIKAGKARADGVARFGADAILFGQIRLALAGEDYAGELAIFAITIPLTAAHKVRRLLERERIRLAKQTKGPPASAQREGGRSALVNPILREPRRLRDEAAPKLPVLTKPAPLRFLFAGTAGLGKTVQFGPNEDEKTLPEFVSFDLRREHWLGDFSFVGNEFQVCALGHMCSKL
jgi:hypothetical protein